MSQSINLRARGLHTFKNELSEVPEGALETADNIIIDRDGVIEPRRGFSKYGADFGVGADRAKQLLNYKDRLLLHYGASLIYDSDGAGTWQTFSGTFTETEADLRVKYIESNGNLYFTTAEGIQKISASSASDFTTASNFIRDSGGVKALDGRGVINYSTAGFFTNESKTAYRIVWGYTDANDNLILGTPSSRVVVVNFSTTDSGTIDITFPIPSDIGTTDTQYFYQIYRTAVFSGTLATLGDIDPGDEMNLVIEDFPTSAELTAREITVNDITPEDFRQNGALLYTNPISGESILQANEPPPIAKDIALYKNTVFYADTKSRQRLEIDFLSVSQLVSDTSTLEITDGTTTNTYTFRGEKEVTDLTFDTFANTTDGGYFLLNSASDERGYVFYADKTGSTVAPSDTDTVGRQIYAVDISAAVTANDVAVAFALVIDALSDFDAPAPAGDTITVTNSDNGNTTDAVDGITGIGGVFAILVTTQGLGEDKPTNKVLLSAAATTAQQLNDTARSLVEIINANSSEIISAYYVSGTDDVPGKIVLEGRQVDTAQFWIIADSTTTGSQFNPTIPTSGSSVASSNDVQPNGLYFSKTQQPEAVPLVNFIPIGPKDKKILRILALRESFFILKEDGIYRLTGENGSFVVDLFDNSSNIVAPDSAVVLNNQIYMLSTDGVVTISDTGVEVVSRSIEDKIIKVTSDLYDFKKTSFGVNYDTDRSYLLFTVTNTTDTVATQCFRYNTFTQLWTRWTLSKTCGLVNSFDNRMYFGPADENFVEKERKNFSRKDYADRDIDLTLPPLSVNTESMIVELSSSANAEVGDSIVQEQYLTIPQFTRLLKKLDLDPQVGDSDYFSTLEVSAGEDLRVALDNLVIKLDADSGIVDTDYAASISGLSAFSDFQSDFNIIVGKLNLDTGVKYINYTESTGTEEFEVIITELVKNTNKVVVKFNIPFIEGPIKLYKSIKTEVIWVPQHFGDPSIIKQVREGTYMFQANSFTSATVTYKSDISPDFEGNDFPSAGNGDFGLFVWGNQNWGGEGSAAPHRTYIPRDKQRCRYLKPRFQHFGAREKFSLLGISLTFRPISERGYKG